MVSAFYFFHNTLNIIVNLNSDSIHWIDSIYFLIFSNTIMMLVKGSGLFIYLNKPLIKSKRGNLVNLFMNYFIFSHGKFSLQHPIYWNLM